ncbi:hypothetical protein CB0940_11072 [Cercospora beticola]|uniref:Uncharacterized protein n=1 Tax=Cercospora beticola TaxID=122368 RepID=A0A2G5HFC2_CERBT|nr:hypothetical protein CB0940_11072 [Cercospora beticola]PIA90933.1 hypothetical protein CB0940_11072 [Cercospora beticola]
MKPPANPPGIIEALSPTETAKLQIQTLYAAITEAHNARQYNRNEEPWYSAMTCSPNLQIEVAYGSRSHVSIDEYLETGKVLFGGNPNLFVEVTNLEIDVWIGDGRKRQGGMQEWSATVWAQQALRDGEVGLVRRSVVIAEFRKDGNDDAEGGGIGELGWEGWRCVSFRNIKGMDDGVGL